MKTKPLLTIFILAIFSLNLTASPNGLREVGPRALEENAEEVSDCPDLTCWFSTTVGALTTTFLSLAIVGWIGAGVSKLRCVTCDCATKAPKYSCGIGFLFAFGAAVTVIVNYGVLEN